MQDSSPLCASISQKGQGNARPLDGALARAAVQLGNRVARNTAVPPSATNDAKALPASGNAIPITTIAVGALVAQ